MTTKLGTGILTWHAAERRSDRYGSVFLMEDGHTSHSTHDPEEKLDFTAIATVEGKRGRLIATVLSPRISTHVGDLFRGIFPSVPTLGEPILLGKGTLFVTPLRAVGLSPDDGRNTDWLDPYALYRAHEQLVDLTFDPEATQ